MINVHVELPSSRKKRYLSNSVKLKLRESSYPSEKHHIYFHLAERDLKTGEIIPTTRVTKGDGDGSNPAENAIDKDLSTLAATNTYNGAGWIKLEFDKTYFIHKVFIYCRFYTNWYDPSDGCTQSKANFKACVDNNNNVDVSVYQGDVKQKTCGTLQLTYGLEQSDQIYRLICNTEGDTVKLSKDTGKIAVYEVATKTKSELIQDSS